MRPFLNPLLIAYFFGPEFNMEVANHALNGTEKGRELAADLIAATKSRKIHQGLQLICFTNLDDGLFMAMLVTADGEPSMISHYISSNHRFFGGQTLLCVPFQFCTFSTPIEGEYLVYRHTYKEPIFSEDEFDKVFKSGAEKEKVRLFQLSRSRQGYKTIPGKSYVGMTKRHWGQRYVEHIESALSKSTSTLYHQTIREMQGKRVICVHDISAFGIGKSDAKEYEKHLIKTSTLAPMGLNMKVG